MDFLKKKVVQPMIDVVKSGGKVFQVSVSFIWIRQLILLVFPVCALPMDSLWHVEVTPSTLALSIAFGCVGGLFPIPGITSVPVALFIFTFGLNPVAAMTVNLVLTPLNIATVPTFIHYGDLIMGQEPTSFSIDDMMEQFSKDKMATLMHYQQALLHGVASWCVFVPLAAGAIYIILYPIFLYTLPKQKEVSPQKKKGKVSKKKV